MGEKSNKQIDPLADLFSNVQLTGLSKPKNKRTTLEPLQIDLPIESTERNPFVVEKSQSGLKKPKRPPRYLGEEYESTASDIEILQNGIPIGEFGSGFNDSELCVAISLVNIDRDLFELKPMGNNGVCITGSV